jgi:hypothetical protein
MQRLSTLINKISNTADGIVLLSILRGLYDRFSTQLLNSGGLTATTTQINLVNNVSAISKGIPFGVAAASPKWTTALFTATGIVLANAQTCVFTLFLAPDGTPTVAASNIATTVTAGTIPPGIVFPAIPEGAVVAGLVVVSASGAWTAGTTAFGTTSTCAYLNIVGPFEPTAIIQ